MKTKQRCSAVGRILDCPSSLVPAKTLLGDSDNEPLRIGNLIHLVLARMVMGADLWDEIPDRARDADVPEKDIRILYAIGCKIWKRLQPYFPEPRAEHPMESELVIGTADVAHHDSATAAVIDWKSGYAEREHRAQVTAYAHAMRETYGMPSNGYIAAAPVHLRSDTMDVLALEDTHLDAFGARLAEALGKVGEVYNPGESCTFCPRAHECGERQQWLRSAAVALTRAQPDAMEPAQLAALYPTVQAVEAACKAYKLAMRSVIGMHGPQSISDGRLLKLLESHDTAIDPLKARPVLVGEMGWDKEAFYECLSMTKKALVERVRVSAPDRGKAKAERTVLAQLENAGAITKTMKRQLRLVKE